MTDTGRNKTVKEKIFISHSSADYDTAKSQMKSLIRLLKRNYETYCSSDKENESEDGDYLHKMIGGELKKCNIFFALITENYLRSPHCLYELSVARFLKKTPFIIYTNDETRERIKDIADPEWISYNFQNIEETKAAIIKRFKIGEGRSSKIIETFLKTIAIIEPTERKYVGMPDDTFNNILLLCQKEGITKLGKGSVYTNAEMVAKFRQAQRIYIVSVTGAGLIKTLKEVAIPEALKNGAVINIILPDRDSQFCIDVADAECNRIEYNPVIAEQNRYRISSEFEAVIQYLNEASCIAKRESPQNKGKITCYNSRTLLRQTIVMTVSDNNYWGWINLNMTPFFTSNTLSFAFNTEKGGDFVKAIEKHCEGLMSMAGGATRTINGKSPASKLEQDLSQNQLYWLQKKKDAEEFMSQRKQKSTVLIEVAAQHPLREGRYPDNEFKKRLDRAIQISREIGQNKVWFYVPGSRHKHNSVADAISLSEAGREYLVGHGVAETHIYADDANKEYKGELGVYNSADESYVASRIFIDNDFGRMICVCSPYQTLRKSFYYLEFGLIAECYGESADSVNAMYHDPVSEYFGSLKHTVYEDHSWQDIHSEVAQNSRTERKVK